MAAPKKNTKKRNWKVIAKRTLLGYAFMAIPLCLFAFFVWVPMGKNIVLSFFKDYSFSGTPSLDNYIGVLKDPQFISAFRNTFLYILWSLVIGYFVPIIIGFLLSELIHANAAFRVLVYLPCMISGIAVVFLYKNIYGDENFSILNLLVTMFGGTPHTWKGNPNLIIPLIVVAMTWRGAGSTALIYLSAFQNVDPTIYEASRIDGANAWQRFFHVTLPSCQGTLLMLLGLQIISVFQVFYEPLVIGNSGGPISGGNYASMSLMLLSYNYAFSSDQNLGYSAATSVILSLIILLFTLAYQGIQIAVKRRNQSHA